MYGISLGASLVTRDYRFYIFMDMMCYVTLIFAQAATVVVSIYDYLTLGHCKGIRGIYFG